MLLLPKRLAWASEGTLKAVMVRARMPAVVRNDAFMVSCEDEKNKQRQDDTPWRARWGANPHGLGLKWQTAACLFGSLHRPA